MAWRGTAEFICKYFAKGRMIAVSGFLQTRTWEDKQRSRHKATELVAQQVSFCGDKPREADPEEPRHPQEPAPDFAQGNLEEIEALDDSDLPF